MAFAFALAGLGLIGCAGLGYLVAMQKTIIEELRGAGERDPPPDAEEVRRVLDPEFYGFKR